MQLTGNYGLKKPEGTDVVDIQDFNDNADIIDGKLKEHATSLSDLVYQTAGGTATAITLTINGTLKTGYPITFIASANNGGGATTINGKKLYKPATTNAPTLITGKAYTVWYNASGDSGNGCFFIKASAEGNATAAHVLAGKTFSNDTDIGLVGGINNYSGATNPIIIEYTPDVMKVQPHLTGGDYLMIDSFPRTTGYMDTTTPMRTWIQGLTAAKIQAGVRLGGATSDTGITGTFTADATALAAEILTGKIAYVNGLKVTGTLADNYNTDNIAATASVSGTTLKLTIPTTARYRQGYHLQATDADFIAANIISGKDIFGVAGSATIESLGGRKYASGSVTLVAGTLKGFARSDGGGNVSLPYVPIRGLAFVPSLIIVWCTDTGTSYYGMYKSTPFRGNAYMVYNAYHDGSSAGSSVFSYTNAGVALNSTDYDVIMPYNGTIAYYIAFE